MNKIRVEGNTLGKDTRVFLDDMDITRFVNHISFDNIGKSDCYPVITLCLAGDVELPLELEAMVKVTQRWGIIDFSKFNRELGL